MKYVKISKTLLRSKGMGQADPFASRCSVKGCREQKIFIWLAPQYMDIRLVGLIVPEGRKGWKGKNEKKRGPDFPFLPILPSGAINPSSLCANHIGRAK